MDPQLSSLQCRRFSVDISICAITVEPPLFLNELYLQVERLGLLLVMVAPVQLVRAIYPS